MIKINEVFFFFFKLTNYPIAPETRLGPRILFLGGFPLERLSVFDYRKARQDGQGSLRRGAQLKQKTAPHEQQPSVWSSAWWPVVWHL